MPAIENDGAMDVEGNEGRAKRRPPLTTVHRLEDIPQFASEAEEPAFWASHELDEALWDQAEPFGPDELPPPRSATKPVAIRFDEHALARFAGKQGDAIRFCRGGGLLCISEQLVERCRCARPIRQLVQSLPIRRHDALL